MAIHNYDFSAGNPQAIPTLEVGDVIRHLQTDPATVYNIIKEEYPDLSLIPITPGTDLYAKHGTGCSYVNYV